MTRDAADDELAALREARHVADVPLAAPGLRPDAPVVSALAAQLDVAEQAIAAGPRYAALSESSAW